MDLTEERKNGGPYRQMWVRESAVPGSVPNASLHNSLGKTEKLPKVCFSTWQTHIRYLIDISK